MAKRRTCKKKSQVVVPRIIKISYRYLLIAASSVVVFIIWFLFIESTSVHYFNQETLLQRSLYKHTKFVHKKYQRKNEFIQNEVQSNSDSMKEGKIKSFSFVSKLDEVLQHRRDFFEKFRKNHNKILSQDYKNENDNYEVKIPVNLDSFHQTKTEYIDRDNRGKNIANNENIYKNFENGVNYFDDDGNDHKRIDSYEEYWENYVAEELQNSFNSDEFIDPKNKLILIYSRMWDEEEWEGVPSSSINTITQTFNCPISACTFTYNRANFNKSDVVLFHLPDERGRSHQLNMLNQYGKRPTHQSWFMFTSESPTSLSTQSDMNDLDDYLFNGTITYDYQSDIVLPYGKYRTLKKKEKRPLMKIYAKDKINAAVWYVSNCGEEIREQLVRMLEQYIPIYVGGNCAVYHTNQTSCIKKDSQTNIKECSGDIQRFKLYLSFESNFCDDYVTEKYWENAIENNVLPVILNGANKNISKVLIPNSFISVDDFESIDELGKYLQRVLSDDTEYNKYFRWKKKYKKVKREPWPYPTELVCKLCEYVHKEKSRKTYYRLADWWSREKCSSSKTYKIKSMMNKHWNAYIKKYQETLDENQTLYDINNNDDDTELQPTSQDDIGW